eukprot:7395271-Pyramimonas_sp.AAC.1
MRRALRNVVAELFVVSYEKNGEKVQQVEGSELLQEYNVLRGHAGIQELEAISMSVGLSRQVYVVVCGVFVSGYPGACGLGCHRGARFLDFQGIVLYTVVVVPVSDISRVIT